MGQTSIELTNKTAANMNCVKNQTIFIFFTFCPNNS